MPNLFKVLATDEEEEEKKKKRHNFFELIVARDLPTLSNSNSNSTTVK